MSQTNQDFHPRNRKERRHPPKMTPKFPNSSPPLQSEMPSLMPLPPELQNLNSDVTSMIAAMSTSSESQPKPSQGPAIGSSGKSGSKPRAGKYDKLEEELSALLASAAGAMLLIPTLQKDSALIMMRGSSLVHAHVEVAKVYPEYYKVLKTLTSGSVLTTCAVETLTLILMIAVGHGLKIPGLDKLLNGPEKGSKQEPIAVNVPIMDGQLPLDDQLVRQAREQMFSNWRAMNEEAAMNGTMDVSAVP
jgi:hypothetical protein